jgi:hypothetical protein
MKRALAATRKRHAHRLAANASGTEIPNEERAAIQNEGAMMTRLLLKALHWFTYSRRAATCQSGYGAVCKTVYPGSIPGVASNKINSLNSL